MSLSFFLIEVLFINRWMKDYFPSHKAFLVHNENDQSSFPSSCWIEKLLVSQSLLCVTLLIFSSKALSKLISICRSWSDNLSWESCLFYLTFIFTNYSSMFFIDSLNYLFWKAIQKWLLSNVWIQIPSGSSSRISFT